MIWLVGDFDSNFVAVIEPAYMDGGRVKMFGLLPTDKLKDLLILYFLANKCHQVFNIITRLFHHFDNDLGTFADCFLLAHTVDIKVALNSFLLRGRLHSQQWHLDCWGGFSSALQWWVMLLLVIVMVISWEERPRRFATASCSPSPHPYSKQLFLVL